MNYLGHLYFSGDSHQLMTGNLLGDFFKGNKFDHIPDFLHRGIRLHRKIDSFMDNHPAVVDLNRKLYKDLPKVSPIVTDIVFDHLLAMRWDNYHTEKRTDFLNAFFTYALSRKNELPANCSLLIQRLADHKMIHKYDDPIILERIPEYIQSRLSFPSKIHRTREVFEEQEDLFSEAFDRYMEDAKKEFL